MIRRILPTLLLSAGILYAASDPAMTPARIFTPKSEADFPAPRHFQGIPGVTATSENTLWAAWYGGGNDEGPDNFVMLARSTDRGESWTDILTVIHHPHEKIRTFDPVVWTAPDGTLWVFYNQAYGWWDGRAGVWAITCADPNADQPQWSSPRRIADGIMMNKPTVLADGRWLLPVAVWSHAPKNDPQRPERNVPEEFKHWDPSKAGTKLVESRDSGKTFTEIASLPTKDVRFDEHMIVERKNGSLWLLIRGINGIQESFSTNRGHTWSKPQPSSIPHINSRFFIRRLHSGALLLVRHLTPEETGIPREKENGKKQNDRSHLTAWISDDDGKTWLGGLLLDKREEVSYPDGSQFDDGTIVITYDISRKKDRQILLSRFSEKDVRAAGFQSPGSKTRILINQPPPLE